MRLDTRAAAPPAARRLARSPARSRTRPSSLPARASYMACSKESDEGLCPAADWSCTPENVARTCNTFSSFGGKCVAIAKYPNATISEYGSLRGAEHMKAEIFARGPISCGIDAEPILDYYGGARKRNARPHTRTPAGGGAGAARSRRSVRALTRLRASLRRACTRQASHRSRATA